jgi:adenylate kinase
MKTSKKPFITLLVTGTPGTGKSILAKKLSLSLDYAYFDVNSFIKKTHIHSGYDRDRHTHVVNTSILARKLLKVRENTLKLGQKGIILDSHLSHFFPSEQADLCLVTICNLKDLQKRLLKRGYSKAKIRENLDAEIFDTCAIEALENHHKILKFDTTKAKTKEFDALLRAIKAKIK